MRAGEDFGVGTKLRVLTYEAQNDAFKSKTTRLNPLSNIFYIFMRSDVCIYFCIRFWRSKATFLYTFVYFPNEPNFKFLSFHLDFGKYDNKYQKK